MHSILTLLAVGCSVVSSATASGIAPYDAEVASSLSSEGAKLSDATVETLLNVIAKHGLQNDYGVYALHEHFSYSKGQAPYEIPLSSSLSFTKVVDYSTIADNSVPVIFGVDSGKANLVPIEFAEKTSGAEASYAALTTAASKGFVNDYANAVKTLPAAQHATVGLAMFTALEKGVLADSGHYVHVKANPENNVKLSTVEDVSQVEKTTSRPTVFGLSKSGPKVVSYCEDCIFHMD